MLFADNVSPRVFNETEKIAAADAETYTWTKNNAFLATRVYTPDPAFSYWEGAWKDKTSKYLAVKLKAGNQFYTGWIRISAGGTQSKMIIHDFGYSKTANAEIKAGDKN